MPPPPDVPGLAVRRAIGCALRLGDDQCRDLSAAGDGGVGHAWLCVVEEAATRGGGFLMAARHIVFAVAPELVLLDACGPLEAFWRAELTVAAAAGGSAASNGNAAEPVAYRTTVASI